MILRLAARRLRRNLLCGALFVGSFVLVDHITPTDMQFIDTPKAVAPSLVAQLAERHGCWSGEAPADMQGVLPGHVLVTSDGETRVGGSRLVGKALEQVFDGADHGLTVHGFCR